MDAANEILKVEDLSIEFDSARGALRAVTDVSFTLHPGEILSFVGESGCGKSITTLALARLVESPPGRIASGRVMLKKRSGEKVDVLSLPPGELQKIRGGEIAYIFQEPSVSLNPVFRIGEQIAEGIRLHRPDVANPLREAVEYLRKVGISDPDDRVRRYPHELSGGMQQRVMIAMALACEPSILIADEPTTALDVTIQAGILDLIASLRDSNGMSVILVTHNLGIVSLLADRVCVMYGGRIVETAAACDIFRDPCHPYTKALTGAVPRLGLDTGRLITIPGSVPLPWEFPAGCRFYGRCALAEKASEKERLLCRNEVPPWKTCSGSGHMAACHLCRDGGEG